MSKFTYEVDIPGYGTQVVESDTKLTELQAYEYAKANAQPRSMGQEFVRSAGIATRGAAPVATGAGLGFLVGGAPGALAGALSLPLAEIGTTAANVVLPEKYQIPSPSASVESLLTKAGLPVPETRSERILQGVSGALPMTGIQTLASNVLSKTATTQFGRGIAEQMAREPARQFAAAAPATAASQTAYEVTGRPELGMLAGMVASAPFAVGTKTMTPTKETLVAQSNAAFEAAKNSGIAFNPTRFSQGMSKIAADMRQEGYTPTGYPKIEAAFKELTDVNMPKDFTELQALRKIIQNAQASTDPAEKRLATILKDRFDDYVLNSSKSDLTGTGNKTGVAAWNQAKNSYSRMMKAEVFEDMLFNAQLDKSKFTQSGAENSMAQQLRNLAKNDSKMRLFTKAEQAEIIAAAKGSSVQNLLKFFGKFAPTSTVSSILPVGAIAVNPYVGVPLAAGAAASRVAATQMRKGAIESLADTMRKGGLYPKEEPAIRALAARGLISPQTPITQEELDLLSGK